MALRPITNRGRVGFESGDYAREAAKLAECLVHPDGLMSIASGEPFVLGICGPWGSGKTEFANRVIGEVEERRWQVDVEDGFESFPQALVIRFEPWAFDEASALVSNFFLQIGERVEAFGREYSACGIEPSADSAHVKSLGDEFFNRLRKLIRGFDVVAAASAALSSLGASLTTAGVIGALNEVLGSLGKAFDDAREDGERTEESIPTDFESWKGELAQSLGRLGVRIVVCVDNIDRLRQEQMRLVFALVAAIADFPTLSYVLVFDEGVVSRALGSVHGELGNAEHGRAFLEKVVSLWYPLPALDMGKLVGSLMSKLKEDLDLSEDPFISAIPDDATRLALLRYLLRTPRVAWRLRDNLLVWKEMEREPRISGLYGGEALMLECYLSIWHPVFYGQLCDEGSHAGEYAKTVGGEFGQFLAGAHPARASADSANVLAARWLREMAGTGASRYADSTLGMLQEMLRKFTAGPGQPSTYERGEARLVELAICCHLITKLQEGRNATIDAASAASSAFMSADEKEREYTIITEAEKFTSPY